MNVITLTGRLTRDPEIRQTQSGMKVASFGLAVNRRYQQGEQKTDFFNCSCFGNRADIIEKYFVKGNRIAVSGEVNINNYTGNDGITRTNVNVLVDIIDFIDTKGETEALRQMEATASTAAPAQPAPAPQQARPQPAQQTYTYGVNGAKPVPSPAPTPNPVPPNAAPIEGFSIDQDIDDDDDLPF